MTETILYSQRYYFPGIKTLAQTGITDNYNAVGETVSIAGVIVSKDKPTFVSLLIDSKDLRITPIIGDADNDRNVSIYNYNLHVEMDVIFDRLVRFRN